MENETHQRDPKKNYARPAALAIAGVLAGAIAASTFSASAQTPSPSQSPSASSSASPNAEKPARVDETPLTGTNADKARAAALKAVPGGTIVRLETDSGPAEYEAHMRKADGTPVTVLMDANFAVTSIEEGRAGGHGRGGRGGDCDEDTSGTSPGTPSTPSASASTTSA